MGAPFGLARSHRQQRLRAIERLHLRRAGRSLRRDRDVSSMSSAHTLPSVATEMYLTGLSVLNQALGLLEEALGDAGAERV